MTKAEHFYRGKYPKVKELSLMDKEIIEILTEFQTSINVVNETQENVSVLLFDFLCYVRHGTQETPIKEIKDGIRNFLANYKR